ncbi:MAG: hypothetical protein WA939_13400, partial [Nodosilinea sp.]
SEAEPIEGSFKMPQNYPLIQQCRKISPLKVFESLLNTFQGGEEVVVFKAQPCVSTDRAVC